MLAAFVGSLAVQVVSLRRMEVTFGEMADHEEEMRRALAFEDAVRDQYDLEMRLVRGETADLATYTSARSRVLDLGRALCDSVDEPAALEKLNEVRRAATKLDQMFRDEIAPAVKRKDPAAALAHERAYPLVSTIEEGVDDLVGMLQETSSQSRRALMHLEGQVLRWTAALLLATPLLMAAAVYYLSRSVARPLARLSEGAAAVAAGDLDARIDLPRSDEFGRLAADFNAMTVALKHHQHRLVESEKLAGIGRLAAGLAHELNNPLQVMLGYLSLNRDLPDRRLAEQLSAVEDEARRCKDVVDALLELSRPSPAAAPAPVDLRVLCEDVSGRLGVWMKPAPPRLSVGGAGIAMADRARLRQVVFNLMKNAAEAAGPAGGVEVEIGASNGAVEVAIRDDGPGIAAEARDHLFEPFFTTKSAGTGLGLAVSRAMARAQGGDIEFRNGESRGAVFTLRLPRAPEGRT
ncbi:MAG TPA: HAMP domain-containing sensor histidine kinase [Anaeromyxobacteraceae bacterium]|nr:HAMP domain-containing sensor histidine kinase [Anaeromyxobacteraceae bacterium]